MYSVGLLYIMCKVYVVQWAAESGQSAGAGGGGGGLEAQLVPASGKQRRGGGESLSKNEGPSGHRVSTTPSLHFL